MTRWVLIALGWTSLVLGIIGIFLPILPTTPFVILAAWCFSRSSQRFHDWLRNHRYFGLIVRSWEEGRGIPRHIRNRVLILLWFSLFSSSLILRSGWIALLLMLVGTGVTLYLLRLPVLDQWPPEEGDPEGDSGVNGAGNKREDGDR
ncbi:YbaN family protein [Pseudomaricurvus sp. HS19]|uniref:YbaN family protein n=1 Tax=Pseudomaricurvus sp. HS19 TaxID=2692626 RepID=UPI0013690913|nr:YbaN family protein [Pseudomaricurvus sp. HS19]MYM62611.1 DUF454 family protein [Pseudomaricurvus sp. HS19]